MTRAYATPDLYCEYLLERIRALEAEIREGIKHIGGLETEAREQDRRLERLKARTRVG